MDAHRLAEARSLAYHATIAARLSEERQSSPFAGALSPAERWEFWRSTKLVADGRP